MFLLMKGSGMRIDPPAHHCEVELALEAGDERQVLWRQEDDTELMAAFEGR